MTIFFRDFQLHHLNGPLTDMRSYEIEGECSTHFQIRADDQRLIWVPRFQAQMKDYQ